MGGLFHDGSIMKYFDRPLRNLTLAVVVATANSTTAPSIGAQNGSPVPRMWNDDEMARLEVPLSHATFSPKHVSAKYYYQIPIRPIFRSYAVYAPGREPAGYFESLQQRDPEQIRIEASQTLASYETFIPEHPIEPRGLEFLAPETLQEVERIHAALPTAKFTVPPRLLQKMMAWERAFAAAGGLLGAGVDPWETGILPGLGNLRNYELLVEAGFLPEQAIRIMTLNGARILGEEARIGSIETGKRADLVVVHGDPLRTPAEIYDVVTVFRDGVGFDSLNLRAAARGRVGID